MARDNNRRTFGKAVFCSVLVEAVQVSQEESAILREGVPYVKIFRYNPKHLCPKLNGYGDNGQRSLKL
jgi:hypothetical protein